MLFLYLAVGFGVFGILSWFIGLFFPYDSNARDKSLEIGLFSILGIIISIIFMITGSLIMTFQHNEKWVEDYRYDIVASNDSSKTEGKFGLFSGRINEQAVYIYYYPLGDGKYKQGWIAEDVTTIVETKEDNGYIIVYKDADCVNSWYGLNSCGEDNKQFELVVPEGSVIQEHQFDLED